MRYSDKTWIFWNIKSARTALPYKCVLKSLNSDLPWFWRIYFGHSLHYIYVWLPEVPVWLRHCFHNYRNRKPCCLVQYLCIKPAPYDTDHAYFIHVTDATAAQRMVGGGCAADAPASDSLVGWDLVKRGCDVQSSHPGRLSVFSTEEPGEANSCSRSSATYTRAAT